MSIPRRLGRIARGFAASLQEDERFRETLRTGRERGEALRGAFEAALRGATEEWRSSEQRRAAEEQRGERLVVRSAHALEGTRPGGTRPT